MNFRRGPTNMAEGLRAARTELVSRGRPNVNKFAVVLTPIHSYDGVSARQEAMMTRAAGITIVTVSIGPLANPFEMAAIASYPTAANALTINDFTGLDDSLANRLTNIFCNSKLYCLVALLCIYSYGKKSVRSRLSGLDHLDCLVSIISIVWSRSSRLSGLDHLDCLVSIILIVWSQSSRLSGLDHVDRLVLINNQFA